VKPHQNIIVALAALALAGCSTGLLGGGGGSRPGPVEASIPVNNELALPPDLALRAPGTYNPQVAAAPQNDAIYSDAPPVTNPPKARALPGQDIYEKYGIDVNKPDGTRKSDTQLRAELRAAVQADKRKSNPRYGTIFNMRELFNDK
jgi:hypothetical protein